MTSSFFNKNCRGRVAERMERAAYRNDLKVNNFSNKSKNKTNARKRLVFIVLYAFIIGYCSYQLIFVQQTYLNELNKENRTLVHGIQDQEKKKEYNQNKLAQADSQEVIENLAREKLGLIKPNEKLFIDSSEK